jgi:hypothetical protein
VVDVIVMSTYWLTNVGYIHAVARVPSRALSSAGKEYIDGHDVIGVDRSNEHSQCSCVEHVIVR